jgi:hypothetical protein
MPPTKADTPTRFVVPPGVHSIGSDSGHVHKVEGGYIDCEECARANGWPAEGAPPVVPERLVNTAMAMNQ